MSKKERWWQGKKGEWYVITQAALFVLVAAGPRTAPGIPLWGNGLGRGAAIAGDLVMSAGLLLAIYGFVSLGSNLTPLPRPKEDAQLVQTGAYRLVRHPIYSGVVFLAYGWAIAVTSWLTLAYATIVFFFFDAKSRREERWLVEKYPGYLAYRRRVRKLIPFIY